MLFPTNSYIQLVIFLSFSCLISCQEVSSELTEKEIVSEPIIRLNESMILVPSGTFTMGCTSADKDCDRDERPAHQVNVDSFYMDKFEVTNAQFVSFLNDYGTDKSKLEEFKKKKLVYEHEDNPMKKEGKKWVLDDSLANYPAAFISWFGAYEYAEFYGLRLPTEAEWEWAAKGATASKKFKYSGSNRLKKVAWFAENSQEKPHQVGEKQPNELGLFDLTGNVNEWCADWYRADQYYNVAFKNHDGFKPRHRVLRGGSWYDKKEDCRILNRGMSLPYNAGPTYGFRCVRSYKIE